MGILDASQQQEAGMIQIEFTYRRAYTYMQRFTEISGGSQWVEMTAHEDIARDESFSTKEQAEQAIEIAKQDPCCVRIQQIKKTETARSVPCYRGTPDA